MDTTTGRTTYGQCRCCLVTGHHRDIMKTYYRNGNREVYFDVFLDCFNLFLSNSPKMSTLICTACIQRLSDASQFKAMVMESEQRLLAATGHQDTLFVHVPEMSVSDIKVETSGDEIEVKVEVDEDEADDGDAYDEFLAAEAIGVPVSPSLVEGEAELLSRFRAGSVPLLPTRASLHILDPKFDYHLECLADKVVLPSMIEDLLKGKDSKAAIEFNSKRFISEKTALVHNASVLLENSTLTPFKSKTRTGFPCFFCRNTFESVQAMRDHQKQHKKKDFKGVLATHGLESLIVYVDTTDLKCTICDEAIKNINELKTHLVKQHKVKYYSDFSDRVIPFKLSDNEVFECQSCGFSYETFGSIERHMNVHYRNYVCKECGSGFVTRYRLKVHITGMHVKGNFPCTFCKKIFPSHQKLKNHIDFVHKMRKRFKCPKCSERFTEYFQRQKHLVSVHGLAPLQYRCKVCDKTFDRRYTLSRHMKRDHLEERDFQCEMCSYTCFTNNELRVHMIKHNGERIFECAVCKKAYARKKTLKEHMRIHQNDRRFACAICGQAFVQKCSLKGHMKSHHQFNM